MRAEFSEFSFAYALTESLFLSIRQSLPKAGLTGSRATMPFFTTQREEYGVGYDVAIKSLNHCLMFLQFKTCDGMIRKGAKEISKYGLCLRVPFLRMNLMPSSRSPQHKLLMELENKGFSVYYAAPRYYTCGDFVCYYSEECILKQSVFIQPNKIGPLPDDKPHCVSFECSSKFGWFLSEPRKVSDILFGRDVVEKMAETMQERRSGDISVSTALEVIERLLMEQGITEKIFDSTPEKTPLERLMELSIRYLGALPLLFYNPGK